MAGRSSRNIILYSFPAVIALITIVWYRRKKRKEKEIKNIKQTSLFNSINEDTDSEQFHNESNIQIDSLYDDELHLEIEQNILSERTDDLNQKNVANNFCVLLDEENLETQFSETKCSATTVPEVLNATKKTIDNANSSTVSESEIYIKTDIKDLNGAPRMICDKEEVISPIECNSDTSQTFIKVISPIECNSDISQTFMKDSPNDIINSTVKKIMDNSIEDQYFSTVKSTESIEKEYENETIDSCDSIQNSIHDSYNETKDDDNDQSDQSINCKIENSETIENQLEKKEEKVILETENNVDNEKLGSKDIQADDDSGYKTHLDNTMQQETSEETENSSSQNHYSDIRSEGSSDSGKGSSDIQTNDHTHLHLPFTEDGLSVYEFEIPQEYCGRLIGRQGKSVNYIKNHSKANVFIKKHPVNPNMKLCTIEGNAIEIATALEYIRRRFPPVDFSDLTLTQFNTTNGPVGAPPIPETVQLRLPEGISCDVIMSSMVTAGHFFVQQPTHVTYPNLSRLDSYMVTCYTQLDTPQLPRPVEAGVICAAPVMSGWYRAQVVYVCDGMEECDVKFVDYGGYSRVPISTLRQIRSDFMTLPFQAVECYLANVQPCEEGGVWSVESCATFEELAQGQILQAHVVCYADDNIPYVRLFKVQGMSTIFINEELVSRGVAQWIEHS
ncbi:KH domain-containing protein akap-1-like isoform X2 [Centruroides vittatus]|uniref:KH domain-containing protein akap-1-like isoform X2 n=1 Tax=Centruroides vittatus TaxID=120091 RepID=UPI00350FFAB5